MSKSQKTKLLISVAVSSLMFSSVLNGSAYAVSVANLGDNSNYDTLGAMQLSLNNTAEELRAIEQGRVTTTARRANRGGAGSFTDDHWVEQ